MGARPLYFTQDCLVCGRPMRVRAELLGERICCGHCGAICVAGEETIVSNTPQRIHDTFATASRFMRRLYEYWDVKS